MKLATPERSSSVRAPARPTPTASAGHPERRALDGTRELQTFLPGGGIEPAASTKFPERTPMSDTKDKIKAGIDKAADKTKAVAGKAVDKTKDAARSAGDAMKKAGQKLKDAGKR